MKPRDPASGQPAQSSCLPTDDPMWSWSSAILWVTFFGCLCFALQLVLQYQGLGDNVHSIKSELTMIHPMSPPDGHDSLQRFVF